VLIYRHPKVKAAVWPSCLTKKGAKFDCVESFLKSSLVSNIFGSQFNSGNSLKIVDCNAFVLFTKLPLLFCEIIS
jgi:hypothetical protein